MHTTSTQTNFDDAKNDNLHANSFDEGNIELSPSVHERLAPEVIKEARALILKQAQIQGQPINMLDALATITQWKIPRLVQALEHTVGLRWLSDAALNALSARLDLLPLARAIQFNCLIGHNERRQLVGVLSDPFDADAQIWLESQTQQPIEIGFSSALSIRAYLARLSESTHAVDEVIQDNRAAATMANLAKFPDSTTKANQTI